MEERLFTLVLLVTVTTVNMRCSYCSDVLIMTI